MNEQHFPPDDRRFPEPEIIPPGEPEMRPRATWTRLVIDDEGVHRISVRKVGPLGLFVVWVSAALVAVTVIALVLSAVVVLLPLALLLVAGGFLASWLRSSTRRWF